VARTLDVYPKAVLTGSSWLYTLSVSEQGGAGSEFRHTVPAAVTAEVPLSVLKLSFELVVADTDTDQDVDDALFVDDIKPGGGVETVAGNWIDTAEDIIGGLTPGYDRDDFWADWSKQNTSKVRADARRALVTQRGWTVNAVHQHEGDGTATEE
jgi:hypothetical protein